MIPNNKYYKDIAVILGYEWDNHHHSSLVYMKAIAESYGYTYSTRKPSNKFLRDWHTGLTEDTPSEHKVNLWYLRKIAEHLGASEGLNENQCLAYIKDNIENPPTPSQFDGISLSATPDILSYVDGDSATLSAQLTYQGEPAYLSGKSVSFDIIDGQGTVLSHIGSGTTNSNGVATCTYTSQGIGDIKVDASVDNRSIVSESCPIQDIVKYDATEHSYTGGQFNVYPYAPQTFTLPSHFKFGFKLMNKSTYTGNGVLRVFIHSSSDTANNQPNNGLWMQFDGATKVDGGTRTNGSTELNTSQPTKSINTWVDMEMEVNGTSVTFKIDGTQVGTASKSWITNYSNWVVRLLSDTTVGDWAYKELKIIPL